MVLPEPGWLTHEKAQVLLSGSQLWRETIADLSEAQILDPNDVRLRMPTKETYIPEGESESLHRNMGGVERDDTPVSTPLPLPQPL
jgi:hypothetical protein